MVRHVISSACFSYHLLHYADSIFCCPRAPRLDIAQATIKQLPTYELHGVLGQTYNSFMSKSSGGANVNVNISANSQVGAQVQMQMLNLSINAF